MCDKCNKSEMEDLGTTPHGYHLFRKQNEAGGHTYYSDECGCGVMVWDTCLVDESTLLTAIVCEHQRLYLEKMVESGWKPPPDMVIEQMAATGGSFIPPDVQKALEDVEQLKTDGYPSGVSISPEMGIKYLAATNPDSLGSGIMPTLCLDKHNI